MLGNNDNSLGVGCVGVVVVAADVIRMHHIIFCGSGVLLFLGINPVYIPSRHALQGLLQLNANSRRNESSVMLHRVVVVLRTSLPLSSVISSVIIPREPDHG